MLTAVRNAFRIHDLRNKILFTLFIFAIYRLGAQIPVPGVDLDAIRTFADQAEDSGFIGLLNCKNTDYAAFFGGNSTQRPKKYDTKEATANADLSSKIPYLMATCDRVRSLSRERARTRSQVDRITLR